MGKSKMKAAPDDLLTKCIIVLLVLMKESCLKVQWLNASWFLCRIQSVYRPAQGFVRDILHSEYRAATDVYALMFLTDVIDFIIIVFGFWAFGVRHELVIVWLTVIYRNENYKEIKKITVYLNQVFLMPGLFWKWDL